LEQNYSGTGNDVILKLFFYENMKFAVILNKVFLRDFDSIFIRSEQLVSCEPFIRGAPLL